MKINKLTIKSFRGILDAEINFNGSSAVIFGNNGAGKTSVLSAINLLYSNIINAIVKNRFKQGVKIESGDVKGGSNACELCVDFSAFGNNYSYSRFYNRYTNKRTHTIKDINEFLLYFNPFYEETPNENINIPIFVNYGIHRLVLDVPLRIRQHHSFDTLSAYEKAIENKIDFRTFFEWFRNREDLENEIKVRENYDYQDKQLTAVKKAILSFFDGFTDIRVHRNPLAMMVTKDYVRLNIKQLSDGEKCALAMIGDLARRIAIANPSLDEPLLGNGIVLIDEIELHMHPTWQRKIIPTLRKTFPNIQFIFTTHSPQILSQIDEEMKVFSSINDIEKHSIIFTEHQPLNGWDVNDILGNFMNTPEINIDTGALIESIYDAIDLKEFDRADRLIEELENKTNSKNKNVIELKFILKQRRGS